MTPTVLRGYRSMSKEERTQYQDFDQPWRNEDILRELYHERGYSESGVADVLGCSQSTVHRWMENHEIVRRERLGHQTVPDELLDKDVLWEMYIEKRMTTTEISKKLGCGSTTVSSYLDRHNIPTRKSTFYYEQLDDSEQVREWYVSEEMTAEQISEKVGCSLPAVYKALKRYGIGRRAPAAGREGSEHWNWSGGAPEYYGPNWPEQRKKALERDGYVCRSCGTTQEEHITEEGRGLHVHHRVRFGAFAPFDGPEDYEEANVLSNLLSFCSSCHRRWEKIPVQPPASL